MVGWGSGRRAASNLLEHAGVVVGVTVGQDDGVDGAW